jgi:hypothetical protein
MIDPLQDPLPESVIWSYMSEARENERQRIAEWLRYDLAMTRAGYGAAPLYNTLADAIERKDHYKPRPE